MLNYIAVVHKDPDSDYSVCFPDFPGCVTAGTTIDEAVEMAYEALPFHIEGMVEDGDPIPRPTPLEDILKDPDYSDCFTTFIVSVPRPDKSVRINVIVSASKLKIIDGLAKQHNMSRSAFMVDSAIKQMEAH